MSSTINQKYKDGVFRALFGKENCRENLLSLYNALNDTDYEDTEDLVINTLEDVIFINIKNDVSCIIDQNLSLYEHQSTFCPNMPVRGLMYFGKLYSSVIEPREHVIYGTHLFKLPTPQYYVFYNGSADRPDREILHLSDAFVHPVKEGVFEWTAIVLNINRGHNQQLMEACKTLKEYSIFMDQIRKYRKQLGDTSQAVEHAISDCIRDGILEEFLRAQRAEVIEMCLTSFDEEKYRITLRDEAYEDGLAVGLKQGLEQGLEQGTRDGYLQSTLSYLKTLTKSGLMTLIEAMDLLQVPEEDREYFEEQLRKN